MKVLYISNIRQVNKDTILDGDDAHLVYSLDSFLRTKNDIFVDSHLPYFNGIFKIMRSLRTGKNYERKTCGAIRNSIDNLLNLLRIILLDLPKAFNLIIRIKPDLIYERTKFLRYYNFHYFLKKYSNLVYFVEVEAPPYEFQYLNHNYFFYRIVEYFECLKYRHAQAIFVVSHALKQHIINKYKVNKDKIFVLHNSADTDTFFEDKELRIKYRNMLGINDKFAIGFVGAPQILWHSHDVLCEAVNILSKDISNLHLIFVGIEKHDLLAKEIELSRIKKVEISCVGNKTPKEVNAILNATDICVLSGTNWYCSPMKLFEYGLIGKPVIAVDMPNVREIANKENLVLFFRKEDSLDLAKKIKLLYSDENLRKELGCNFKSHIQANFSWDNNIKKIIDTYEKIVKKRNMNNDYKSCDQDVNS